MVLATDSFAQNSFYVSGDNMDLMLVDAQNCSYTIICNTIDLALNDIALTPNQNLYSTDGQKVYSLNNFDCSYYSVSDTIPNFGQWLNSLVAINDEFLLTASNSGDLYKVSTISNNTSLVGNIGYGSGGDLTWYKGYLYMASWGNGLIKIDLNDTYDQIINVVWVGNMSTPASSIYGILTIGENYCEGDNQEILAFENQDLYIVNTENASVQLLCNNVYSCQASGAASFSEVTTSDYNVSLMFPNVFTPNNDDFNDYFQPIIKENIKEITIDIYNRWGNRIFSETGSSVIWNGKDINGEECCEGVYYYIIEYTTICDSVLFDNGFITLIQ